MRGARSAFQREERHAIAYEASHNFICGPDFPAVLPELRKRYMVFSCEGIGKYKILPESYETVARMLQLDVSQCLMVACHNFDLDAAKAVGFKTAFVRRPDEWGSPGPPDPEPNPHHDIIVDTFPQLAEALGCKD